MARVAIVTGAGSGMGRATAIRLARDGCDVVVAELDPARAAAVAEEIGAAAVAVALDVSDAAAVDALVADTVARSGRLDVMVANAGVPHGAPFLELDLATWERVLAVNLKGVFLCGQAAARAMIAGGRPGAIVNVASTYSEVTAEGASAYSASKGGVRMLTKSMAFELGPQGIRVNAVGPGWIQTGMNPLDDPAQIEQLEPTIPLRRIGLPDDVADVIAFLASEDARYVSGQTLFVDGGWLTSRA
ncbi:MAG TPA: SDR family NAD(P)-dependent oxidoreductase [Gaiellales bacterium]|jgi:NAD(P)-dependent dehydrogenase (short-subunit alcohol dehydrogenase family)